MLSARDNNLAGDNARWPNQSILAVATSTGDKPRVAIFPIANETSEHVDSQLQALLSDIEGYLVESQIVDVVSLENQRRMMAEVNKQHGGGFDPNKIVEYNKQMGTQFYFTGKVFASDERTNKRRRVQYFMHLQVIDVATSGIRFQHKSEVSKGMIK